MRHLRPIWVTNGLRSTEGESMISLGIDIGGTGCKCVAFCHDGTQLAQAYCEYAVSSGTVNLPADTMWQSVVQVIRRCADQLEEKSDVAVVTVSSFGESFVALDQNDQPLTDILMYFGNSESQEFTELVERVGEERFMQIAKVYPDASYSLAKMLYTNKVAARPVWKFLFIAGYICYRMTGRACCDVSLACRSLLYDVQAGCWSHELLTSCGLEEKLLPLVLPTGALVGNIRQEVSDLLGLPGDVQIVMGSHDQIVNALGAGVTEIGDAVDTSGTCECITPLFPAIPESLEFQRHNFACVPYLDSKGYVTYAYNISAGSVVRWYRDALASHLKEEAQKEGRSIYDLLNDTCPTEPTNLMVLPYLQGMGGTPDVDPGATGLVAGLTTQTRLPDLYRAILEGVTYEMRYNQEMLQEADIPLKRLFACGGGARSRAWLQIKADILGCEIIPVKVEETGAMGSAILGLSAITGEHPFSVARRFWHYEAPVRPNERHQELYDKKYQIFKTWRRVSQELKQMQQ